MMFCYTMIATWKKTIMLRHVNHLNVYSAKRLKELGRPEAVANLNEQQRAIYYFIKSKGKATLQVILRKFGLSQMEIENQVVIRRHLELTKGKKEVNNKYTVTF